VRKIWGTHFEPLSLWIKHAPGSRSASHGKCFIINDRHRDIREATPFSTGFRQKTVAPLLVLQDFGPGAKSFPRKPTGKPARAAFGPVLTRKHAQWALIV
jgi:hypothetical protein